MSKFSERLKACMEEMDIKPSELSKITGIDKSSISRYLKGDYVPKQLKVTILADALHVDPGWLFTGVKQEKVPNYANLKNVVPLELKKVPLLGTIAAGRRLIMKFHERLKSLRCSKNITQGELAKMTGLSRSAVSMYESGKRRPDYETLEMLADFFNVNMDYLLGKSDTNTDYSNIKNIVPLELKKVPLLGTIAAGKPILCDEHIELLLPCDANLNADFALRVHGDSMIDVSYFDGDIVFIHQQPVVEDGQIAAVRIDDSATLKRFYKIPGGCMLLPENAKYKAMTFTSDNCDDIAIIGIPVAKYTKHVAQ